MNKEFFEKYSIVAYPREIIFYDKNGKGRKETYYVDRKISDYISLSQEKIDKLEAQQYRISEEICEDIEQLQQENKKYKEAINKIKKICESTPPDWSICGIEVVSRIENVLKEVE